MKKHYTVITRERSTQIEVNLFTDEVFCAMQRFSFPRIELFIIFMDFESKLRPCYQFDTYNMKLFALNQICWNIYHCYGERNAPSPQRKFREFAKQKRHTKKVSLTQNQTGRSLPFLFFLNGRKRLLFILAVASRQCMEPICAERN